MIRRVRSKTVERRAEPFDKWAGTESKGEWLRVCAADVACEEVKFGRKGSGRR